MPNLNEMIENDVQILERDSAKCPPGILAQVVRTVCWIDEKNANNRKYRRAVWENVFNDPVFKRKMENRQILGEHEHPESSALKLDKDRTSHIVSKMYFGEAVLREGVMRTPVKAVFDILPTDSGKFVWILHEAGVKVGASTRADGSLIEKIDEDGSKYMDVNEKDYRFTTIDNTGDPSCSNTEPESIISAVRNHYEKKDISKNVAMALLESVKNEAARALEKIIMEDKTSGPDSTESFKDLKKNMKRNEELDKPGKSADGKTQKVTQKMTAEATVKEELTTSSDSSGQPANLEAAKEDYEASKKRGEHTDKKMVDVTNKPTDMHMSETKVDEATGDRIRQFLQDNWEMFLTDQELQANGDPTSKEIDAVRNVAKVFNLPPNVAAEYVNSMKPMAAMPQPVYTAARETVDATTDLQKQLKAVREKYAEDIIRLSMDILALKEKSKKLVDNYSKDSISFVTESASLKEKIAVLEKDLKSNISLKNEATSISEKNVATISQLTEGHKKLTGELNEKSNKLVRELAAKDKAIKEAEERITKLKEANDKEIKNLKEMHHREKINQYVDYRLTSMKLRLHENVLTILRQANSTAEVDALIRETQDSIREGLTQSVGNISQIVVEAPVNKHQVDISNKVGIALKHLTGL